MSSSLSRSRRLSAVVGGGFLGTLARYALSATIQAWLGKGWPYDILLINVIGAYLLAFITSLADATLLVGPTRRLLLNVGFLGAFTTFSTFALGDVLLLHADQWIAALLYVALSIGGGVLAILSGEMTGQWCIHRLRRPGAATNVTRKLTGALRLDIQDDLLVPDENRQPESKH